MKKIAIIAGFVFSFSCLATGRTRVGIPSSGTYYYDGYCYDDGEFSDYWFGPGWYWGIYFDDAATYFAWRQRHEGGPYYWRPHHRYVGE